VGGSAKSVARCHRTVLAYWKFESISLQRRVGCELGFCKGGSAGFFPRPAQQVGRIELRDEKLYQG
jgi:hypothetical protein